MSDSFAKEFVANLNGKISPEVMRIVLDELSIFTKDYTIGRKSTDIVQRDDTLPYCYKIYMVSKKIEGLSPESLSVYNYRLLHFFNHVCKPINDITSNDIRAYLYNAQSKGKLSNRSLDSVRLVINTFMEWCVSEGYITLNPCKSIKPIKYEQKQRTPLSDIELELVRMACTSIREKAIVEFFYSTGCRVSEIIRLDSNDVDLINGEVHLWGKGNKHRISYINAKSEVTLKKYLETRVDNNPALFVTKNKPYKRLTKSGMEYIVGQIGKRSEIGRSLYPHLIRHTTATDALNRGMDVVEVQKILGHEKLDTTMIYAKVSQENVRHHHKKYIV